LQEGLSSKVDDSGQSVGKRYARTDECGIPYAFTIDFDTLEQNTITMRELDSMKQIKLPMTEATAVLNKLSRQTATWA
jgi:glycyl-tRNA synthetase